MKIYVVRHCTTRCSAEKIFCGSSDIPLSEEGRREAELLRQTAAGLKFDLVISSPMLRARETAEAVVGGRDIPILFDNRLSERMFGAFEGTSCARADGKAYRYSFAMKYPGGESNLQVAARVYAFLEELKVRHAGKDVVLVSHGSACRIIRTYFMEMTDDAFYAYSQPNGSIEQYEL